MKRWTNPLCRGQGGVHLDAAVGRPGAETAAAGAAAAAELSLNFIGSAVAIYISSDPGSANASVILDGEERGAVVGYSPVARHARHLWLAQNLSSGRMHSLVLRFGSGSLNISGLDVWK